MILRLYYDKANGDVFHVVNMHTITTVERDFEVYPILSERNRDTFDYIELKFEQYAQDFAECNGYRVNPETRTIEFSYPNPNEEEPQEPVYQPPLTEQVEQQQEIINALGKEITDIKLQLLLGGM